MDTRNSKTLSQIFYTKLCQIRKDYENKNFKLILIRHGESLANLEPSLIGGRSPQTRLSPKGELQAANLGKYLQKLFEQTNQKIDLIYSSPLIRCTQTAKLCLSEYDPVLSPVLIDKICFDERLIEFSQGEWENKVRGEIYTLETQNLINKQKTWFCPPGAESLRMLKNRSTNFLETKILTKFGQNELEVELQNKLENELENKTESELKNQTVIVIFGHGMWIKVLLMEILGLDQIITVNLQIDNCSLTELEFGDFGWKLNYFNRICA